MEMNQSPNTSASTGTGPRPSHPSSPERLIREAAIHVLAQGEKLLESISDESFTRPLEVAFGASIGGHYRHCLDHFICLSRGLDRTEIDYDRRDRDLEMERNRSRAMTATRQLKEELDRMDETLLSRSLRAKTRVHYQGGLSQSMPSTVGRELMYVVAHAIHHYALIAIMARTMGLQVGADFGMAPSTIVHQLETSGGA